jgi:ubiquinone biosynthesis protein UbiJ
MLLEPFAAILNRNVAQSAKAQALVGQLDGRALSLAADGTPLAFTMRVTGGRIELTERTGTADAEISGTPLALLSLAGANGERSLRAGAVRIAGDAEVAQKFRDLLRHAQPDAEEELSRMIGDVAAHQVAGFARALFDWGRRASNTLSTSIAEYLQEEGRDVPTRTELDEFLRDVDTLRNDVERLDARLQRVLAQRGVS